MCGDSVLSHNYGLFSYVMALERRKTFAVASLLENSSAFANAAERFTWEESQHVLMFSLEPGEN